MNPHLESLQLLLSQQGRAAPGCSCSICNCNPKHLGPGTGTGHSKQLWGRVSWCWRMAWLQLARLPWEPRVRGKEATIPAWCAWAWPPWVLNTVQHRSPPPRPLPLLLRTRPTLHSLSEASPRAGLYTKPAGYLQDTASLNCFLITY